MSIKIKTGQMSTYSNGEMHGLDMIIGDTAESINAIEQKGAETLASIPEDYTELSEKVDKKIVAADNTVTNDTPGTYFTSRITLSNVTSTGGFPQNNGLVITYVRGSRVLQELTGSDINSTFKRFWNTSNASWSEWSEGAMKSDITALNDKMEKTPTERTFLTNGADMLTLKAGVYGIKPTNKPSQGLPSGLSTYGNLIVHTVGADSGYYNYEYTDYVGRMAKWDGQNNKWIEYALKSDLVHMDYIEATFSNGVASYNMASKLSAIGATTLKRVICQISSSAYNTTVVRSCDTSGSTLRIALNTNTSATLGLFICYTAS